MKAADRGRLTPGEIQAQLLLAMVDAAGAPAAPRVGLLTALPRNAWAKARDQLCTGIGAGGCWWELEVAGMWEEPVFYRYRQVLVE